MIQRLIYTALKAGIDNVLDDPTILDELFDDLSATEIAAIKTYFATKTPGVHHGYPRQDYDFPLYSIVMGAESEGQHFIGDEAGQVDDVLDPDFGADIKSSIWEHSYPIICIAEHPDAVSYIYEIAKSIFIEASRWFDQQGLFEIGISGMDLAPDPRYIPEHLFARQLMFKCQREFIRTDKESKLGKAFRVQGIHIDKAGSPSDVGGVKTLVTVSGPTSE